ncbi:MAG: YCF48-related protein [Chitinophagaceae bacterium]
MPKLTLCLLLWILMFAACKKEKITFLIQDFSLSNQEPLRKIARLGNKAFIAGGNRWDKASLYTYSSDEGLHEIDLSFSNFQSGLYGIVAKENYILAVGYNGILVNSTDSGLHWHVGQQKDAKEFQSVAIKQDSVIIIGGISFSKGYATTLSKTHFEPWDKTLTSYRFELSDIEMLTNEVGYISGYGALLKTTNGGLNWEFTSAQGDFFKAMAWENENQGVCVGNHGSILKTNNGGQTWDCIRNGNSLTKASLSFKDVCYNGHNTYIAVGEKGLVYLSEDNGQHWKEISPFTTQMLNGVAMLSEKEGIIVGEEGGLFVFTF